MLLQFGQNYVISIYEEFNDYHLYWDKKDSQCIEYEDSDAISYNESDPFDIDITYTKTNSYIFLDQFLIDEYDIYYVPNGDLEEYIFVLELLHLLLLGEMELQIFTL